MRYLAALLTLCVFASAHADETKKSNGKFKELFNGRDLAGWEADEQIWTVEEGLLTGQTTADTKLEHNTFAIWTGGEVDDFHLVAEFRLEGDNNSGVQYRSKRNPDKGKYSIVGYQADIHPAANYVGMLYDEGGRGIAAERGQRVTLGPNDTKELKPQSGELEPADLTKWNKLEVIARGNRLIHKLNGMETIEVTDNDPKNAEAKGLLALQVHAGPPMKVQYKSVRLKPLKPQKDQAAAPSAK
ncbi:MAG: DUF1080 domain-containing protein [Pirellulales bacterium]|nr:DUF1080 domain-containing protein [Pirellulales bacterium]